MIKCCTTEHKNKSVYTLGKYWAWSGGLKIGCENGLGSRVSSCLIPYSKNSGTVGSCTQKHLKNLHLQEYWFPEEWMSSWGQTALEFYECVESFIYFSTDCLPNLCENYLSFSGVRTERRLSDFTKL